MIKVVFVGDTPSRFNIESSLAFVGAKCFDRLITWINEIGPDYYVCLNSDNRSSMNQIKSLYLNDFKLIALGEVAADRLNKEDLKHFKMPHPSGLNRQINDSEFVQNKINEAKEFINGARQN